MRPAVLWKDVWLSLASQRKRTLLIILPAMVAALGVTISIAYAVALQEAGDKVVSDYGVRNCRIFNLRGGPLGLDLRDVEALQAKFASVATFSPVFFAYRVPVASSQATVTVEVTAVEPAYFEVAHGGFTLRRGRPLNDSDNAQARSVCVISVATARDLFPRGGAVVGQRIRVGGATLRIVGVFDGAFMNVRSLVMVPPSTARQRVLGRKPSRIAFWVDPRANVEQVANRVRDFVKQHSRRHTGDKGGPSVITPAFMRNYVEKGSRTAVRVALSVSLLGVVIAFVMVALVMLFSLKQREQEIAIRRAVGATRSDVLAMLRLESAVLLFTGALTGVVISLPTVSLLRAGASRAPYDIRHFLRFHSIVAGAVVILLCLLGVVLTHLVARLSMRRRRARFTA